MDGYDPKNPNPQPHEHQRNFDPNGHLVIKEKVIQMPSGYINEPTPNQELLMKVLVIPSKRLAGGAVSVTYRWQPRAGGISIARPKLLRNPRRARW